MARSEKKGMRSVSTGQTLLQESLLHRPVQSLLVLVPLCLKKLISVVELISDGFSVFLILLLEFVELISDEVSNSFSFWLPRKLISDVKLILLVSSSAATISLLLPQKMVDGTTVPSLFRDLPNLYQIFLISTVFAFVGAFSSLMNQHKPRVERFFGIIAVASILFALAIVLYVTAFWLRWG